MAIALIVLAVGSVVAGFFGVPHALGGHNAIEAFLEPSFQAMTLHGGEVAHAAAVHGDVATELGLMGFSVMVALAGIALATVLFLKQPKRADALATQFSGVHTLLLNKYYVDEIYNAVFVQPIKRISESALWKVVDATIIDGIVNGVGLMVRGWSAVLRRVQTGSVRAYAMSIFVGVVAILGYYLWR